MTNETRERIKHYKDKLPHMKEKLTAAIMMLVVAATVTVTATYAWITLSTAPEVTSIDTTVAANGSLEIALASGTGEAPGKSRAGDSSATEGTDVTAANITWGNLVNLSDPAYGLSKITLRPAALNGTTGLLSNPLYGVGYGEDGRVSNMVTDDDFAYVYYDTDKSVFMADLSGTHLGVRAISTVEYKNLEGASKVMELFRLANEELLKAVNNHGSMTNESNEPGKSYMASLEGLIQLYAQSIIDQRFSGGGPVSELEITGYMKNLYELMLYFYENVAVPTGESYVYLSDVLDLLKGSYQGDSGYTVDTLVQASRAGTLPDYIKNNISSLKQFADDYYQLQVYLKDSETGDFTDLTEAERKKSLAYWAYLASKGIPVLWGDIYEQINWICEINKATLDDLSISSLSSLSNAASILTNGKNPHNAVLHGGAIYRMEQRIGAKMSPVITVKLDISALKKQYAILALLGDSVSLNAELATSATEPYELIADRNAIKAMDGGSYKGTDATAQDTYAMAVDLWVRTNAGSDGSKVLNSESGSFVDEETNETFTTETETTAEQAYLTLEGAVRMGTAETQVMVTDANGEEQPAYTATVTVGEESGTKDVFERYGTYYYLDENGNEIDFENEVKFTYGDTAEITYVKKITQQDVVIGYEGVNRVWNEDQMAGFSDGGTNTTQGGGSCYVFYANTPADQSRFLELLQSMRVVFVDASGKMIGSASMDTENYFAETGKVTVPLVLDKSKAIDLGTDADGNKIYGLTALTKNAATRITALIYLDGTRLTNEMVLASGEIQGTLNIQFGSSVALKSTTVTKDSAGNITDTTVEYQPGKDSEAIKDEDVMSQLIEVSAKVDRNSFEYDKENPAKTNLTVTVDGMEPKNVSVRFMRAISSTQGVLQESVPLSGSGANWSTEVTFDKAGKYVLRTVWVDGVEYNLSTPVEIEVSGISVNSVSFDDITLTDNQATILTADGSFETGMTLGFTSRDTVPEKVNGMFMDEDGNQVNVSFSMQSGEWKGKAKFTSSARYTMEYVEIDGEIYELDSRLQPTLEIILGLKASTWITADTETLANLKSVYENATPTNFILNPEAFKENQDGITLEVSAEIYDNSGNELPGLGNVSLFYGKGGSSVRGLYSEMKWDAVSGRYKGSFYVSEAGNYKFKQVTVKVNGQNNYIESYTTAPSISAKPPGSIEYVENYSRDVQYAKADTKITIGVKNSSAAGYAEATLVNLDTRETVTAKSTEKTAYIGDTDLTDEQYSSKDRSVTAWSFDIPTLDAGKMKGTWQLTSLKMSGIYYKDVEYVYDSENEANSKFAVIDLTSANITTRLIEELQVTLNVGETTLNNANAQFMSVQNAAGVSVTFSDDEGNDINGLIDDKKLAISGVKVTYYLDSADMTTDAFMEEYDYKAESALAVSVSGSSDDTKGRNTSVSAATQYDISNLGFEYAGPYNRCVVEYTVSGDSFSDKVSVDSAVEDSGLKYTVKGANSNAVPEYKVYWGQLPSVKITATNPAPTETFNVNIGEMLNANTVETRNYISEDGLYARLAGKWNSAWNITWPKLTLSLSNAGNFENASVTVVNGANSKKNVTYKFTTQSLNATETLGSTGTTREVIGYQEIDTINLVTSNNNLVVNLQDTVTIYEAESAVPTMVFAVVEAAGTAPETKYMAYKKNKVVLPTVADYTVIETDESATEGETKEQVNTEYYYYSQSGSCGGTTYYPYTYTHTIKQTEYTGNSYNVTYELTGWIITRKSLSDGQITTLNDGNPYTPGTTLEVAEGNYQYTATAVFAQKGEKVTIGTTKTYRISQTASYTPNSSTNNVPSGTKMDNQTAVETLLGNKVNEIKNKYPEPYDSSTPLLD